jgi:hypothetical protein
MPEGITECDTYPLWHDDKNLASNGVPNCYRRLRLFDEHFTRTYLKADRVLQVDLDCVILRNIDALLCAGSTGLRIVKGRQATRYNGSMYLIEPGSHQRLWDDFKPDESPLELKVCRTTGGKRVIGSDQAWISYNVDNASTWSASDGVYQFTQWARTPLTERQHARIVFFAGGMKPWHKNIRRPPYRATELHTTYAQYVKVQETCHACGNRLA